MKLHDLEQAANENIADYLKRTADLVNKLLTDNIEVGMATLKSMADAPKQAWITFECNKDADYSFTQTWAHSILSEIDKAQIALTNHKMPGIRTCQDDIAYVRDMSRRVNANSGADAFNTPV